MKNGTINNCLKCLASYGQYNDDADSDFSEYWCELSIVDPNTGIIKKPKGLCQFCNPKSKYYNK
jgi:hypothetical protein